MTYKHMVGLGVASVVLLSLAWTARHSFSASGRMYALGSQGPTLLQVQVVHRHGARTPLANMFWPETQWADCRDTYPGASIQLVDESGAGHNMSIIDLDMPGLPGGCRMGQLTPDGYEMAVDLGAWLRERYTQDIPLVSAERLDTSQVWLRTTRIQRAMLTLQGVVTGLWPSLSPSESHATSPVLAHASSEAQEYEYGNAKICPTLARLNDMLGVGIAARDARDPELRKQAAQVVEALHLPPNTAGNLSWVRLHDALAAMQAHTPTGLPPGATPDIVKTVNSQAVRHEADMLAPSRESHLLPAHWLPMVPALAVGPLLYHLQENIINAARRRGLAQRANTLEAPWVAALRHADASTRRMLGRSTAGRGRRFAGPDLPAGRPLIIYSGHDSTITPLLMALGRPETEWPPFCASLVFETWYRPGAGGESGGDDALWVRVLSNQAPLSMPPPPGVENAELPGDWSRGWLRLRDLQRRLEQYTLSPSSHALACQETAHLPDTTLFGSE